MNKEMTSKQLVRGAFERADLPRLPFVPWIFRHAAKLEQIPLQRMFSEPTQYVKCLQNTRKLYGHDAITGCFDASLEMEICGYPVKWGSDYGAPAASPKPDFDFDGLKDVDVEGASKTGRFGTVIESLRRINIISGANLAMAAVINGPLTVMAGLVGRDPVKGITENPEETMKAVEATTAFLLKIVQIYCQLQLDIIVIAERMATLLPSEYLSRLQSVLAPVVNTIRFYNAYPVLLPGETSPNNLTSLIDLGFDGIVAGGIDVNTWNSIRGGRSCTLGKAIPASLLATGGTELREYLEIQIKGDTGPGIFLTTDREVPPDTPPENIRMAINLIAQSV